MKWLIIPLVFALQGCTAYNIYSAVNISTGVTTGKSIPDHTASLVSNTDCSTYKFATGKQDYWCEQPRDPATTYNRSSF